MSKRLMTHVYGTFSDACTSHAIANRSGNDDKTMLTTFDVTLKLRHTLAAFKQHSSRDIMTHKLCFSNSTFIVHAERRFLNSLSTAVAAIFVFEHPMRATSYNGL